MQLYSIYNRLWHWARPWLERRLARLALTRHPDYADRPEERFGQLRWSPEWGQPIWIHAVSVGETRAAQPLIARLRQAYPDRPILLTHMTPTGREVGTATWSHDPAIHQAWAPYDARAWVEAFLESAQPTLLILLETELWPNWLRVAAERELPVALLNARLSERSYRRYRRWQRWLPLAWSAVRVVGAQTPADATRLAALGAPHVAVTGNLKFDQPTSPELLARGRQWRQHLGGRAALLWASTREGEERLLLDAWERLCESFPTHWQTPLLVIVPRHPERCDEVGEFLTHRRYRWARRSETPPHAALDVWLGDSLGEMTAYYALSRAALIGGSWKPFGGQNPLEAIAAGCPPIVGPHVFHFEALVASGRQARAIVQCPDAASALRHALRLIHSPERHADQLAKGALFLAAHRGATERTLALLTPLLGPAHAAHLPVPPHAPAAAPYSKS